MSTAQQDVRLYTFQQRGQLNAIARTTPSTNARSAPASAATDYSVVSQELENEMGGQRTGAGAPAWPPHGAFRRRCGWAP